MVLVEETRVAWQVIHEHALEVRVPDVRGHEAMPREDAARGGVDHEHRPPRRVEQDRVRGPRADARDVEELPPQLVDRAREEPAQAAPVPSLEMADEGAQPTRPHPFGVDPDRRLREDGPDDDLERGAGRPPPLGAEATMQAIVETQEPSPERARAREGAPGAHALARARAALAAALAPLLAATLAAAQPAELAVAVGGPPQEPAYLPVYAAAALGTFEAEGVRPRLSRAKHPTAAIDALRDGTAAVAVTTSDQAIRGAWARGRPVRIITAHTETPAVALLVAPGAVAPAGRIEDLRGRRVGIRGPGTTGHFVLGALLAARRIGPAEVEILSLGGPALVGRLGTGDLTAAVLDEPWLGRALAAGARVLLDLREPEDTRRHLGGAFYEIVSVVAAGEEALAALEAPLAAYARALARVQFWLASTPATEVAARLPADLVGDRERFVARLQADHRAYAPRGEATEPGLATTFRVLQSASPWPVSLKLGPRDVREPSFVTDARARLGATPPPP
jgi:ABC-type nitrate/sulfonate/bicarbonate transport system substrate-binding protein